MKNKPRLQKLKVGSMSSRLMDIMFGCGYTIEEVERFAKVWDLYFKELKKLRK